MVPPVMSTAFPRRLFIFVTGTTPGERGGGLFRARLRSGEHLLMLREVPNPKVRNTLSQVRFRLSDKIQTDNACPIKYVNLNEESSAVRFFLREASSADCCRHPSPSPIHSISSTPVLGRAEDQAIT